MAAVTGRKALEPGTDDKKKGRLCVPTWTYFSFRLASLVQPPDFRTGLLPLYLPIRLPVCRYHWSSVKKKRRNWRCIPLTRPSVPNSHPEYTPEEPGQTPLLPDSLTVCFSYPLCEWPAPTPAMQYCCIPRRPARAATAAPEGGGDSQDPLLLPMNMDPGSGKGSSRSGRYAARRSPFWTATKKRYRW